MGKEEDETQTTWKPSFFPAKKAQITLKSRLSQSSTVTKLLGTLSISSALHDPVLLTRIQVLRWDERHELFHEARSVYTD